LTLEESMQVVNAAQVHAADSGWQVTVAVVDEGGLLKALGRMDGAPPLSAQLAEAKAVGAALWHRDGDSLAELHAARPAFFEQVDRMVRVPLLPAAGSVLISRDGQILGAVGVSGAAPDQDKECAVAGPSSVGL